MPTTASPVQRWIETLAAAQPADAVPVKNRTSADRPKVVEAAPVRSLAFGASKGWDPQEVWLTRVHRPRQSRQA